MGLFSGKICNHVYTTLCRLYRFICQFYSSHDLHNAAKFKICELCYISMTAEREKELKNVKCLQLQNGGKANTHSKTDLIFSLKWMICMDKFDEYFCTSFYTIQETGAPNEHIVQNHLNIALLNVF